MLARGGGRVQTPPVKERAVGNGSKCAPAAQQIATAVIEHNILNNKGLLQKTNFIRSRHNRNKGKLSHTGCKHATKNLFASRRQGKLHRILA